MRYKVDLTYRNVGARVQLHEDGMLLRIKLKSTT